MLKEEIVITNAYRTAMRSLGKSLKNTRADELGANIISGLLEKSKIKKEEIDEVILGQVLTSATGQNPARQSLINSGLPKEHPLS